MLRYADSRVVFEDKSESWSFDEKGEASGMSFSQFKQQSDKFDELKTQIPKDLSLNIESAIKGCTTEEQIGLALDPLFEKYNKSFFLSNHVNQDLLLSKANRNTIQKKLQLWHAQLNQNVPVIRANPGIKVFHNKFKNVPCVVVTAGPSLKNAIETLSRLKGRALIMAVDTSFRSLTKRGIEPDFVNAHDAGENGHKFFRGIKTNCVAAFVNYIHPDTIASYDGPITFYYVEDDSISSYKTMAYACDGGRLDGSFMESKVIGGSSVAHTAMYIAIDLGCNPITFVGLDLSYPDMTKSHFESDNAKDISKNQLMNVRAINGKMVKTNLSFYSYKTVFDRMAPALSQLKGVELFNSSQNDDGSPAGIVHQGLKPMPFNLWCEKFATQYKPELMKVTEVISSYGYKL